MRRFSFSLLLLLLAIRMIVSALPVFICHEMGGTHVSTPCCAPDETGLDETSLVASRCCEQEDQAKLDLQRGPKTEAASLLQVPLLAALVPLPLLLPGPLLSTPLSMPRSGALPVGPPPPLRQILRI